MTARPETLNPPQTAAGQSLGAMPGYASSCGRVTLYLGDCRDLLPMECDAVIADPPYGIDYNPDGGGKGPKKIYSKADKVIDDDKPFDPQHLLGLAPIMVLWGGSNFADKLPATRCWLVWDKKCGIYEENQFSDCEIAWTSRNAPIKTYRHRWTGYHRDSERGEHYHPTQKPVSLIAWAMERVKVPAGAVVLDPYMGSGTTGIACIRTGRRFVGIEKDPTHYATALKRITDELAQGDLFLGHNDKNQAREPSVPNTTKTP